MIGYIMFLVIGLIFFTAGLFLIQENIGFIIFLILGGCCAMIGMQIIPMTLKKSKTLKEGIEYRGTIVKYMDGNMIINNVPVLDLVIAYYDKMGEIKTAYVTTGHTSELKWPMFHSVTIKVLGDVAVLTCKKADDYVDNGLLETMKKQQDELNELQENLGV